MPHKAVDKTIPLNFVYYKKQVSFNKITEVLKSNYKYASSHIVKALADDKQHDKSKASHDK